MSETRGMAQHEVTRTLVKSQPEVWTQCSDAESLGRHMSGSFGEIRITRLEPEHSVAWEGEEVSGTVRIEPSAWGTRVTLTVEVVDEIADLEQAAPPPEPQSGAEAVPEPEAVAGPLPEPEAVPEPEPEPKTVVLPEPEIEAVAEPEPPREPEAQSPPRAAAEPASAPTPWARLRAWWRRTSSLEPPPAEDPAPEAAVVEEPVAEGPAAEASAIDDPVTEEPAAEAPVVEDAESDESAPEEPIVEEPVAEEPTSPDGSEAAPATEPATETDAAAVLTAALESLGQAHHRPFSRA